jgi:hypothetical protein
MSRWTSQTSQRRNLLLEDDMCALCEKNGTGKLEGKALTAALDAAGIAMKVKGADLDHLVEFVDRAMGFADDEWDPERDGEWERNRRG